MLKNMRRTLIQAYTAPSVTLKRLLLNHAQCFFLIFSSCGSSVTLGVIESPCFFASFAGRLSSAHRLGTLARTPEPPPA